MFSVQHNKHWQASFLILLIFNILIICSYYALFRKELVALYNNKPSILESITMWLYPRFFTEKHRLSVEFFLHKSEQVVWRWSIFSTLFLWFIKLLCNNKLEHFWQIHTTFARVRFLQLFLIVGWLYESFTWYKSLLKLSHAKAFFEPHLLFRWVVFPSENAIFYGFALLYVCWLLSFWKKYGSFFWGIAIFLIILFQALLYGFGKIDHTYATWTYVSILFTFLLYEAERSSTPNFVDAWSLKLMQVIIACVYLQVSLEKVFISGWKWFLPETMQSHLLTHPTALGLWIAQNSFLCSFLSISVLIWQLGFVAILFFPSLRIAILLTGVLFHTLTFVIMNVGGFSSFWFLVYIVWFLEKKEPSAPLDKSE